MTGVAFQERLNVLETALMTLLNTPPIRFDKNCRSALPEEHGIYRIFNPLEPANTIRAGRTKSAAGGLRQRVYQNHLMGDQAGNLRAQLIRDRVCPDHVSAKRYIIDTLAVQILVVHDAEERSHLEHFMLAVLRPSYSD